MKTYRFSLLTILFIAWPLMAFAETGEKVTPMFMGTMMHVNNKICASSHTPMVENDIGKFTSTVVYSGSNPKFIKFKGKTLIFNQCCSDCIEKFKTQWKENPEAIMEFHGLN